MSKNVFLIFVSAQMKQYCEFFCLFRSYELIAVLAMKGGGGNHKLFSRIIFLFPGSFPAKPSFDTATMRTTLLDQRPNF